MMDGELPEIHMSFLGKVSSKREGYRLDYNTYRDFYGRCAWVMNFDEWRVDLIHLLYHRFEDIAPCLCSPAWSYYTKLRRLDPLKLTFEDCSMLIDHEYKLKAMEEINAMTSNVISEMDNELGTLVSKNKEVSNV